MSNQTKWISRTVMVNNNNVEEAMKVLNGIMANEGMMQRWKLTRRYANSGTFKKCSNITFRSKFYSW